MTSTENKFKTHAIGLRWETRYRKGEHLSGDGAFCPELDAFDQDFAEALKFHGLCAGKLLEIGTGVGMQAIRYAEAGFDVIATDVSLTAIEQARKNAEQTCVNPGRIKFIADNILATSLRGPFDVIADRGCFTTFKDWELEEYCRNVHSLLNVAGWFLLKINSGCNNMIKALESRFNVENSKDTFYHGERTVGPPAIFLILKPLLEQKI